MGGDGWMDDSRGVVSAGPGSLATTMDVCAQLELPRGLSLLLWSSVDDAGMGCRFSVGQPPMVSFGMGVDVVALAGFFRRPDSPPLKTS